MQEKIKSLELFFENSESGFKYHFLHEISQFYYKEKRETKDVIYQKECSEILNRAKQISFLMNDISHDHTTELNTAFHALTQISWQHMYDSGKFDSFLNTLQ
jgi:hypothetical protein